MSLQTLKAFLMIWIYKIKENSTFTKPDIYQAYPPKMEG